MKTCTVILSSRWISKISNRNVIILPSHPHLNHPFLPHFPIFLFAFLYVVALNKLNVIIIESYSSRLHAIFHLQCCGKFYLFTRSITFSQIQYKMREIKFKQRENWKSTFFWNWKLKLILQFSWLENWNDIEKKKSFFVFQKVFLKCENLF